ncbi:3-oxoacyl-[acyl-carrier-protein] synthase 2 [Rubripirellula amarantea]|uniref:3-oxoacyl-[acyl-carrier-protein] synthase 2 n=1 Tax=Rubripirellula amarantea TaxID=2527999 RepID=A0A5C5WQC9_9BACT|nr:beta-ketoacyl synthase N-terminal-like domain-containing protein [Rubripirellula amarantea]TWT52747.1 3-oxoacyl-[acyl-carrier-protein] synthase 2 [Rubripirellula amarantea]
MSARNVFITGLGIVSSIGIGKEAFFEGLLEKRSGVTSLADRTDEGAVPRKQDLDPKNPAAGLWIGAPILDFDAKLYVTPRKALKVMCREIQTSFAASQLSIKDAGVADHFPLSDDSDLDRSDVGTVFGSEMFYGPPSEMQDAFLACNDEQGEFDASLFGGAAMKKVLPLWMLKYLPNMPACHVGISLGAHGPNNSLVLGDVSGPAAMMEAQSCLQRNIAKLMLTGSVGTRINTTRMNYRGDLPIAETFSPVELASRPYDPTSRGVVGGEAAVTFVLETQSQLDARDAKPLARISALVSRFVASPAMKNGIRSTASSVEAGRGSAKAIELAIQDALAQANLNASDIGAVISQACGDVSIDACEAQAIRSTLPDCPITAPIAALGHTGAAAGSVNIAVGLLTLGHKKIPPTIQSSDRKRTLPLLENARSLDQPHVMCLSHTSEGSATAVILSSS